MNIVYVDECELTTNPNGNKRKSERERQAITFRRCPQLTDLIFKYMFGTCA